MQPDHERINAITLFTIGHSNRTIDEFINLLKKYEIKLLADIRLLPGSKHAPQFNRDNLERSLLEAEIDYIHLVNLGGRRKADKNSINTGWRNTSFRGYADYMQTKNFDEGLTSYYLQQKKR